VKYNEHYLKVPSIAIDFPFQTFMFTNDLHYYRKAALLTSLFKQRRSQISESDEDDASLL